MTTKIEKAKLLRAFHIHCVALRRSSGHLSTDLSACMSPCAFKTEGMKMFKRAGSDAERTDQRVPVPVDTSPSSLPTVCTIVSVTLVRPTLFLPFFEFFTILPRECNPVFVSHPFTPHLQRTHFKFSSYTMEQRTLT